MTLIDMLWNAFLIHLLCGCLVAILGTWNVTELGKQHAEENIVMRILLSTPMLYVMTIVTWPLLLVMCIRALKEDSMNVPRINCFIFTAICLVLCAANVWCVVTHQPSSLHLNLLSAIVSGVAAVLTFIVGLSV